MAQNDQLEFVSILKPFEVVHGEEHRHFADFFSFLGGDQRRAVAEVEGATVLRPTDEFDPRDDVVPDLHETIDAAFVPASCGRGKGARHSPDNSLMVWALRLARRTLTEFPGRTASGVQHPWEGDLHDQA